MKDELEIDLYTKGTYTVCNMRYVVCDQWGYKERFQIDKKRLRDDRRNHGTILG